MTEFQRAYVSEEETQRNIADYMDNWRDNKGDTRKLGRATTEAEALVEITALFKAIHDEESIYRNDVYQVNIRRVGSPTAGWPPMVHLSIKRIDRQPLHDWRELQEIKNRLIGRENEGVEIYPAESRRVDTSNQYHLWVLSNPEARFPFGFDTRCVIETPGGKAVQRKLKEGT